MSSHRGLSAVVGTVFLVAVVIGALSYVSYSLDVMGNFSESLIVEESRQRDKQAESFTIESIDVTGASKLDGVIKNTGEIPLELTTLWIDEQGVNDVVQKFTLSEEIAPGSSVDISSLVDFTMDSDKGYNMKVVSSRGEVSSFYVNSLADENVYMSLTASPTVIPSTFTSTLIYTVVNNMSNGNYLYNLTPVMNDTRQTLGLESAGLTYEMVGGEPTPSSYESLGPGEVAVFTYEIKLTGETDGDLQLFNVTLANANQGNEALASVAVQTVPLATDAGSALTSLGLTESDSDLTDVMYFHMDTTLTPNGERPMDGSSPNTGGETQSPNGNTLTFLSSAMTAQTTVPLGKFNTTLTYYSSMVPLGFVQPDLAFMMDCFECGRDDPNEIADSMGNAGNDGLKAWDGYPDFFSTGGPHGDGYYHFDDTGDEHFWHDWQVSGSDHSDIDGYPDATAFWVKIDSDGYKNNVTILESGDCCHDEEDRYGFDMVSDGEIQFEIVVDDNGDAEDEVACVTPTGDGVEYNDDTWYHVVGVRDDHLSCKLYINGVLMDSESKPDPGEDDVDSDFWGIGWDERHNQGGDCDCAIASLLHWNGDNGDLDSIPFTGAEGAAEVLELYNTNYGDSATRLNYQVDIVDSDNTTVEHNLIPLTLNYLPFKDAALGNYDNQVGDPWINVNTINGTDQKYYGDPTTNDPTFFTANLTATSIAEGTLDIGERLRLTISWPEDSNNLPINIMWDDSTFQGVSEWNFGDGPTFLQTPEPTPRWPTFLSFDSQESITYRAFNEGPEGVWFTYGGTRLVLTSIDGLTSYGATPRYVNGSDANAEINSGRDSLYIPDQYYAEITFWPIQAPPDDNDSINPCSATCEVPNGDYDAALYLQGYDEGGETFKKTVNLGLVHITGNP